MHMNHCQTKIRQLERDVEVTTLPELSTAKTSEMMACALLTRHKTNVLPFRLTSLNTSVQIMINVLQHKPTKLLK
jgi:hypothetical protein